MENKKQNEKLKKINDFLKKDEIKLIEKIKFSLFELIVTIVVISLVCLLIGYFCGTKENKVSVPNIPNDEGIQTLIEEYNYILKNYYGEIDKQKLILGAINGMLNYLDPHSEVIDEDSNNFSITLEGTYEGIGVGVNNDTSGNVIIVTVYPNTPAAKAGLKPGDIVKKVNNHELNGVSSSEFVNIVSDAKEVKLTIMRGEEIFEKTLVKEIVILESVFSEMHEDNIGYISVSIFANNTYAQFKKALEELEKQGMQKLIIDLRSNSGGHLSAVERMLYLFLDETHVIYQTQDKEKTTKFYSKGKVDKSYPIVILQDSASASASEIMAAALKEELGAYIVGKTSYGKGTVQELQTVDGIGQYKFTTKKWLTPKGNWIDGDGIKPDLEVSLTVEYLENPGFETDAQYQAAIKYFKK